MLVRSAICALLGCAIILIAQTQAQAKRGGAATTTSTTRKADNRKPANASADKSLDDEDDGPADVKTGKSRAREFEKGKTVDNAKTQGQIGKLTGQVDSLNAALKGKSTKGGSQADDDDDDTVPAKRKKSRRPTTQPTTQPAKEAKRHVPQPEL
jgi:hypothetical protein